MSAKFDTAEASRLIAEVRAKLTFIENLASAARDLHAASADDRHDQATESVFEAISESATSVLNDSDDCPLARLGRMIEEVAA